MNESGEGEDNTPSRKNNAKKNLEIQKIIVHLNMQNEKEAKKAVKDSKPKKQAISKSYLVKSFSENIKKLTETELITREETAQLIEIHKNAVNKWVESMTN